jgi:WD40 repeat protein/outer membrane protein assembly factor BamD (BamD/ComL family)
MAKTPPNPLENLRSVIAQAIKAYELAQTTHVQAEREAQDELQKRLKTLQAQQQSKRQQVEAKHKQEIAEATAKQQRINDLIMALDQLKQASHILLEKTSLAYILGEPIDPKSVPPNGSKDKAVASDFADAQVAFADLRAALLRLATAYSNDARWDEARRVVQPLLDDTQSALYKQARNLYCKTYYDPAVAALNAEKWEEARQGFEAVLSVHAGYKEAKQLWCETYYQPAVAALKKGEWEIARQGFESVITRIPGYHNTEELWCETYYQPALAALEKGEWEEARHNLEALLSRNKTYRDTPVLLRQTHISLFQSAMKAGRQDEARQYIKTWLKEHKDDAEFRDMLCESYYKPAVAALQSEHWSTACEELEALLRINATYQDASLLLREAYLRPAKKALNKMQFDEASRYLNSWLQKHEKDAQMLDLLCEVYYQSATQAIQAQDWKQALDRLKILRSLNPNYQDIAFWPARYPLFAWMAGSIGAIKRFDWPTNAPIFAFSPRRKLVVAVGQNQMMKIWEADSGSEKVTRATGHTGLVSVLAFSPDGKLLVSASQDKTMRVEEVDTGKLLYLLKDHQEAVDKLAFSPDGRLLISWTAVDRGGWGGDKAMRVWDIQKGQLLHTLSGFRKYVYDVIFSTDGGLLATLIGDNTLKVWEIHTGQLHYAFDGVAEPNKEFARSGRTIKFGQLAAFSPDRRLLAIIRAERSSKILGQSISVWDLATDRSLYNLKSGGYFNAVTFSANGQLLTSDVLYDYTTSISKRRVRVIAWELDMGRQLFDFGQSKQDISSMLFSPDKRLLVLVHNDSTEVWDFAKRRLIHTLKTGFVNDVTFSSDGRILVFVDNAHSNSSVTVYGPNI